MFNLTNKTAIVTGASRGIGRAISIKLAEAGADIAVVSLNDGEMANETVESVVSLGRKAKAYDCHVEDFSATEELISEIVKDFCHVDILVNNAGINRDKLMLQMKEEDFDAVIGVDLKGVFNMTRHCYPLFVKQKSGKIVNISSIAGLMGNAGQTNYSAAKAGVVGMTKSAAKELATRGICVNAIAPGFIETDMTARFADNKEILDQIPMKKMGKAEDVAYLALFLASDMSNFITGEVIRIDGGMAM